MLEFVRQNAPVVSALASVGTLMIWAVYLHIFVGGHQRLIKPMLVINRGEGRTLDAKCLVTNMSRDPVHIQSVVAKIITGTATHTAYITDAEDVRRSGNTTGWERLTRQGPLQPGVMIDMGTYGCIVDYAAQTCCGAKQFVGSDLERETTSIEIAILGIYGSEDLLIGASRRFEIDRSVNELEIRATTALTRQITRKSERRQLSSELELQL